MSRFSYATIDSDAFASKEMERPSQQAESVLASRSGTRHTEPDIKPHVAYPESMSLHPPAMIASQSGRAPLVSSSPVGHYPLPMPTVVETSQRMGASVKPEEIMTLKGKEVPKSGYCPKHGYRTPVNWGEPSQGAH